MRHRPIIAIVLVAALFAALTAGCEKREPTPPTPADREGGPAPEPTTEPPPPPTTQPADDTDVDAAAEKPAGAAHMDDEHLARAQKLIDGGLAFLLVRQNDDGTWDLGGGAQKPAATALVLKCLVQAPEYGPDSEPVREGFDALMSYRQEDGGFYDPQVGYQNYTTSVAVMAMTAAGDPRFNDEIRDAVSYLRGLQIVPGDETPDGEDVDPAHPFVGGVSYGKHGRPDGSNAGMWAQAMHDAGVDPDDPAMQRMLGFFSRMQNRSESNAMPWAAEGPNDGGFVYAPATADNLQMGESKAGPGLGGRGLRSYGSLTYQGFKSMLYAGLTADDPRVQAAFDWIRNHWRLDSNPNMPGARSRQGLYYYYQAFAKALRAWGRAVIEDADGAEHNWREELIDTLAERVRDDGSWTNTADRWNEGSPVLVTCYSVMALQETLK